MLFNNDSNNDYHLIMKWLAELFGGQFECLGENTEKYMTFSKLIKKQTKNDNSNTCKINSLIV